jgi:hypothetical protein
MRIFLLVSFAVTTALASTTAFAQDGDNQRRFRQNVRKNEAPSFQSNGGFKRGFAPVVKRNEFAPGPSRPPRPSITAQFQKPVEAAPRKSVTPVRPAPRIFSTPFPKTADAGTIPAQPSRPPKRAEFAPPKQVEPRPKASVPVGQPSRQIEVSEQLGAPPTLAAPPPPKPAPIPVNIQSAPPPKVAQAPIPVELQAPPAPKPVADPAAALAVQQAELTPPPQAEEAQPAPAPQAAPALVAPAPTTAGEETTGSTAEEAAAPPQVEAPAIIAPKPVETAPVKRKKKKIVRYYEDDYAAYDEYNSTGGGYGYASDEYGYGGGYSSGYGNGGSCD